MLIIEKEHKQSTLMSKTKKELVKHIMFIEHNNNVLNERIEIQARYVEKLLNKQWILCSERFPTEEEYLKHDGRFIVTDGNRTYEGLFDMYDGLFKKDCFGCVLEEDNCVIAWMPLPEPYKVGDSDE